MTASQTVQNINTYLNNLPKTIKESPVDEQCAYCCILIGLLVIIITIFWKILF